MICLECNNYIPDDSKFCHFCGIEIIKKTTKENCSRKNRIIILGLLFTCMILILLNVFQLVVRNSDIKKHKEIVKNSEVKTNELYSRIDSLRKDNLSLEMKLNNQSDKLNFFDDSIVFVIDGYGRYYYSYDRMMELVGDKEFTYWAYNVERARYEGFRPGK